MLTLPDYQIASKIYQSSRTLIYRGKRTTDVLPVIIKTPRVDYPSLLEIAQFKHEYQISSGLSGSRIIQVYSLEHYKNQIALIEEDFGGESLDKILQTEALTLLEKVTIATQLAEAIAQLHQHQIIHKDIKPQNIIVNRDTCQLKLIDFGIASRFSKENPTLKHPNTFEGTLAYMSPEQTGRMNRYIDYRTDFYSWGITVYELLTGQLPFNAADPMELVHAQIAVTPIPPDQINPEIPPILAKIILKCLAKTAEERYQVAWGLKTDLETCLHQLETTGKAENFTLACQDISDRFQIPQKLYGREREAKVLLATFKRIIKQKSKQELTLISGYSGIGKTSLVREIYKPLTRQKGYFISGKFDQFKKNTPYAALTSVFSDLIKQILTENQEKLQYWRENIIQILGHNGRVIVDLIPDLELIIGEQPTVPELGITETQNRFNLMFTNFIRVFGKIEHPVVIFLDDLQWVDSATLRLLELILTDENLHYLYLIGAYRDHEVYPTHPLQLFLKKIGDRHVPVNEIYLSPLNLDCISQLIAETLHQEVTIIKPLAKLVLSKTSGNPFFINEFLKTLVQEKAIFFNCDRLCWEWDIHQIEAMGITDNVVELLISKFKKLEPLTRRILKLAACIGNHFHSHTLSIIAEQSESLILEALQTVVDLELIQPVEHQIVDNRSRNFPGFNTHYKFSHDRIQQAAYTLINEVRRKSVHYKIGRLLQSHLSEQEREEKFFEWLDQINLGRELMTTEIERIELAELNLKAGCRAKESTAYSSSRKYFALAIECLPLTCWDNYYSLTLDLYKKLAELEYLNGNLSKSETLIQTALSHAKTAIEKAEIYNLLIIEYTLQAKYQEAINIGRQALSFLDIELPEVHLKSAIAQELAAAKASLANREIFQLIDSPNLEEVKYKLAINILKNIDPPAYFIDLDLYTLIVLKSVNISLKYGNAPESPKGYATYGLLLGSVLGDYRSGYQFGLLALAISEKLHNLSQKTQVITLLVGFLNHWINAFQAVEETRQAGYLTGLEAGEFQFAGYLLIFNNLNDFHQGKALESLQTDLSHSLHFNTKTNNQWAIDALQGCNIIVSNLRGLTSNLNLFQDATTTEEDYLTRCFANSSYSWICTYKILKAKALYIYNNPLESLLCLAEAKPYLSYILGNFSGAEYNFYQSLNWAFLYPLVSPKEQPTLHQNIINNQQQMKIWSENCPENFQHKHLLIEAELAWLENRKIEALELGDQALDLALQNGFIADAGIAAERVAKFWLNRGKTKVAEAYLQEARYHYQCWGAVRKVEQLEAQYSEYFEPRFRDLLTNSTISSISSSSRSLEALDLLTVLKAYQAISSEIVLDKLLNKLMQIAMENAGAQKGVILLERQGNLSIAAVESTLEPKALHCQLPDVNQILPRSVIDYVSRTSQSVILHDASQDSTFANDPYIETHQPKSLLCTPIQSSGKLIGIVYLENNLTTSVFTDDRLKVLQLLCSQAAISLENAVLYQELMKLNQAIQESEAREREKANQLEQSLETLQQTQLHLVQSEKMSSLGNLVAGVAHEINNPLSFITGNLAHTSECLEDIFEHLHLYQQHFPNPGEAILDHAEEIDLDYLREDLPKMLDSIQLGAERIRQISTSLRTFSRLETANKIKFNIHDGIDSTLVILKHRLKASQHHPEIQIIRNYGSLPEMNCYPGQLNQVFMNLIANAIDAFEELNQNRCYAEIAQNPNQITIATNFQEDRQIVTIQIADNGPGMTPEIQEKVFKQWFTTKPVGKGTGLGLSISRQIIEEKHGGKLSYRSHLGEGTTFIIEIPQN